MARYYSALIWVEIGLLMVSLYHLRRELSRPPHEYGPAPAIIYTLPPTLLDYPPFGCPMDDIEIDEWKASPPACVPKKQVPR